MLEPVHLQGCGIYEGPGDARQVIGMQLLGLAAAAARQGPQQCAPVHRLEVAGALNFVIGWDAGGNVFENQEFTNQTSVAVELQHTLVLVDLELREPRVFPAKNQTHELELAFHFGSLEV